MNRKQKRHAKLKGPIPGSLRAVPAGQNIPIPPNNKLMGQPSFEEVFRPLFLAKILGDLRIMKDRLSGICDVNPGHPVAIAASSMVTLMAYIDTLESAVNAKTLEEITNDPRFKPVDQGARGKSERSNGSPREV